MLQNKSISSVWASGKISSDSLSEVPVYSKDSINNTSALCKDLFGLYLTNITGWCNLLGKRVVLSLYGHVRGSMSLMQFTHIQTLCIKLSPPLLATTEPTVLGRYVSFLASWFAFPKDRKLVLLGNICLLFLSSAHMNSQIFYIWFKKTKNPKQINKRSGGNPGSDGVCQCLSVL